MVVLRMGGGLHAFLKVEFGVGMEGMLLGMLHDFLEVGVVGADFGMSVPILALCIRED